MRTIFGILAISIALSAHAELYKSVDENGNVTYTDKSGAKSQPVQPPGLTSYAPPKRHTEADTPEPASGQSPPSVAKVTSYSSIAIRQPANGTTLRDSAGVLPITLEITPALDVAAGHALVVLINGKSVSRSQALEFKLENVERGEHRITARVIDAKGKVLKESAAVTVQLHRPSVARKGGR